MAAGQKRVEHHGYSRRWEPPHQPTGGILRIRDIRYALGIERGHVKIEHRRFGGEIEVGRPTLFFAVRTIRLNA